MTNKLFEKVVGDRIFTVKFTKADGTLRVMNCRLGVKKYLNPNSKGLSDNQVQAISDNNLLAVLDMDVVKKAGIDLKKSSQEILASIRPYRNIPCDRVLEINTDKVNLRKVGEQFILTEKD